MLPETSDVPRKVTMHRKTSTKTLRKTKILVT